jgi:hypothetical protein
MGGTTLLFRQQGENWIPRYAIYRCVDSPRREREQQRFLDGCDRKLAQAWRAFSPDKTSELLIQQFTRQLHPLSAQGDWS